MVDLTVRLERKTSIEEILKHLIDQESGPLKGILGVSKEESVSSDFMGDSRSSIVDATSCVQLNECFYKLIAWYDNEWGYSSRVSDVVVDCITKMEKNL